MQCRRRKSGKRDRLVAAAVAQWQDLQDRSLAIMHWSLDEFPDRFRQLRTAFIAGDANALKEPRQGFMHLNGMVLNITWAYFLAMSLPYVSTADQKRDAARMGCCATGVFYMEQMDKVLSRPILSVGMGAAFSQLDAYWQTACEQGSLPFGLDRVLTEDEYDVVCKKLRNALPDPFA